MLEFRGTHGTSATRAKKIESSQEFLLSRGIRGNGVYFWRKNSYSHDLAIGWFRSERNKGKYNTDSDRRCAVIHATMTVDDNEYFDLNDMDNEDDILEIFKEKGYKDAHDAATFFEEVIDITEEENGSKFKLIITRVTSTQMSDYPWQSFGRPGCYIVRDPSCITIESVDVVPN